MGTYLKDCVDQGKTCLSMFILSKSLDKYKIMWEIIQKWEKWTILQLAEPDADPGSWKSAKNHEELIPHLNNIILKIEITLLFKRT